MFKIYFSIIYVIQTLFTTVIKKNIFGAISWG